jgi:hypothetical protein
MTSRSEKTQPRIYDGVFRGKKAWTRATIRAQDYLVPIPPEAMSEIHRFVDWLRRNPLQTELLSEADHAFPQTRRLMRRVKRILTHGAGFALLDRLPVKAFTKDELKAVYWVLSRMIARPVAQSFSGTMLYDVIDTERKKSPKVRADLTREELDFHTDYSYNRAPPFIGLQVLRTSKSGGRSSVASLNTAHNEMRRRHPELLARLYRPFYLNRYGEHAPGDPLASRHPVFAYDGKTVFGRFNPRNITAGYDLMGEPLDQQGADAIEALSSVLEDPARHLNFQLKPGQVQYLMNGRCAHKRTEYQDHPEPDRRRHLVRIFLRDEGRRSYNG